MPQIAQGFLLAPLLSRLTRKRSVLLMAKITRADLETLASMLASGALAPVIEQRYPLHEAAEAVAYVAEGHARGKVVVEMSPQR
jgi:NADPH:quinone reductase-like Zn-dependent oxidoreductase